MANRIHAVRAAICACTAALAAEAGAADKCPIEPGRWKGLFTGEYVAARFEKEPSAFHVFLGAEMTLDVHCDGRVTATFTHGAGRYQAFSSGPPMKTGKCTVAFDYRIISAKVETGARGTPVFTIRADVKSHPPECTGELTSIAKRWSAQAVDVSTFTFEATTAKPRRGMFGDAWTHWDNIYNYMLRFDDDGFQKAKKTLWYINRVGAIE